MKTLRKTKVLIGCPTIKETKNKLRTVHSPIQTLPHGHVKIKPRLGAYSGDEAS